MLQRLVNLFPIESQPLDIDQLYEPEVRATIESIVKPGWVCVDVGAYIGHIALLLARLVGPTGRVIAFEAHPENVEQLRHNMAVRSLTESVQVEDMAVSDGASDSQWLYAGRSLASTSEWNIVGHDVEGRETEPVVQVKATSLDKYFPPGSRVDFVKIDIEGAEAYALAGMRRLLMEIKPVVLIEFHNEAGWEGRNELYAAGYHLYDMNGHKLEPNSDTQRVYHCLALPANRQN